MPFFHLWIDIDSTGNWNVSRNAVGSWWKWKKREINDIDNNYRFVRRTDEKKTLFVLLLSNVLLFVRTMKAKFQLSSIQRTRRKENFKYQRTTNSFEILQSEKSFEGCECPMTSLIARRQELFFMKITTIEKRMRRKPEIMIQLQW